jgi:adenylate cyclase
MQSQHAARLTLSATDVAQLALGLGDPADADRSLSLRGDRECGFAGIRVELRPDPGGVLEPSRRSIAFLQLFVVVVVWMHGAIGLYSVAGDSKPIWRRIGGLVLPVLFAVPDSSRCSASLPPARRCSTSSRPMPPGAR